MRSIQAGALAAVLLAGGAAAADSPFDGTWKADASAAKFSGKPTIQILLRGVYRCTSCAPPFTVAADGARHAVAGQPYFDSATVKVLGDRKVEVLSEQGGKPVEDMTFTASADGKTRSDDYTVTDRASGAAKEITGKNVYTLVKLGPAGSHAISGSWMPTSMSGSDNGLTFTLKVDGDKLTMTAPTGESYTAPLSGHMAPYHGDPGTTAVTVKKVGKNALLETDYRSGKAIATEKMTVSGDGASMMFVWTDLLRDMTTSLPTTKQ